MYEILQKSFTCIESLTFDNFTLESKSDQNSTFNIIFNLHYFKSLTHLAVEYYMHHSFWDHWCANQYLEHLQYLELRQMNGMKPQLLLKIINYHCHNLVVFDCHFANNLAVIENKKDMTLKFPSSLEYLRLKACFEYFALDLSNCKSLVVLSLVDKIVPAVVVDNISNESGDNINRAHAAEYNDVVSSISLQTLFNSYIVEWPSSIIPLLCLDEIIMENETPNYINMWYEMFGRARIENTSNINVNGKYDLPPVKYILYCKKPSSNMNTDDDKNMSLMLNRKIRCLVICMYMYVLYV